MARDVKSRRLFHAALYFLGNVSVVDCNHQLASSPDRWMSKTSTTRVNIIDRFKDPLPAAHNYAMAYILLVLSVVQISIHRKAGHIESL